MDTTPGVGSGGPEDGRRRTRPDADLHAARARFWAALEGVPEAGADQGEGLDEHDDDAEAEAPTALAASHSSGR